MSARIQETIIALGKGKQADIATANLAANMWRFEKLNAALMDSRLNTEDDAAMIGKGDEFARTLYKTSWDSGGTLEKYGSVEFLTWALAFALGGVSYDTGTYTITPLDLVSGGLELPYFTMAEAIRPGAEVVLDRRMVGLVAESVELAMTNGPGRGNCRVTVACIGSGKEDSPSTYDYTASPLDAIVAEKALNSSSATVSINGTDYVANKNLLSLNIGWKNNINADTGFYIGSGFQTGGDASSGAIRGRLEVGARTPSLTFVTRYDKNSTELTKLKALTTGSATVTLTNDTNNNVQVVFHKVAFSVVQIGDTDGIVTAAVTCTPIKDEDDGLITVTAKCAVAGICAAPA